MQGDLTGAVRADIEKYKVDNAIPDDPKRITQPWSGRRRLIEIYSKMGHPTDSLASTELLRLKDKAICYTDTSSYVHCTQPGLNSYALEWRERTSVRKSRSHAGDTVFKTCMVIHTHLRAIVRYCLFGWELASIEQLRKMEHPSRDIIDSEEEYV